MVTRASLGFGYARVLASGPLELMPLHPNFHLLATIGRRGFKSNKDQTNKRRKRSNPNPKGKGRVSGPTSLTIIGSNIVELQEGLRATAIHCHPSRLPCMVSRRHHNVTDARRLGGGMVTLGDEHPHGHHHHRSILVSLMFTRSRE
jgi:hypothetical protein